MFLEENFYVIKNLIKYNIIYNFLDYIRIIWIQFALTNIKYFVMTLKF